MELKLKELRKAKGISQEDLAEMLGAKLRTYGSWERGENMINLEQACQICTILGCSLDELAGREPRKRNPQRDKLVADYEALDDAGRGAVSAAIDALARAQKKEAPAADSRGIA